MASDALVVQTTEGHVTFINGSFFFLSHIAINFGFSGI